jgi:hypothetical protein
VCIHEIGGIRLVSADEGIAAGYCYGPKVVSI